MLCRIAPGSSSPTPSVRSAARATSSRVNQPASATSTESTCNVWSPIHPSDEAHHQGRRERPGLARHVAHIGHFDPDLLPDLTSDRALQGLPRLHEARERGEPALAPGLASTQQAPVTAIVHDHDHGRIGTREVLAGIVGADPDPPGLGLNGGRAADRAMRMPPMPQLQGDGRGQQRSVEIVRRCCDLPECPPLGRPIRSRHGDREVRHLVDDAEQPARRVDVAGGRIRECALEVTAASRRTGDRPSGETTITRARDQASASQCGVAATIGGPVVGDAGQSWRSRIRTAARPAPPSSALAGRRDAGRIADDDRHEPRRPPNSSRRRGS